MKCPKCHSDNPDDSLYCSRCATPLPAAEDISALSTKTLIMFAEKLTRGSTFAGRYEVIEELGEGGMGKVYRVEDKKIKEEIALKLIRSEIAADMKTIERFGNELKYARKVSHRNVCRMYDIGEEKGTHYITMEYVPGEDLRSMIRMTKQLSVGTAVNIAKQICEGLAEAHRLGVVHRDIKSSNIVIDRNGNARIMDFGLACSLKGNGITSAGMIIGTPDYMSPEQVVGKEIDQCSDIYSLGIILYEMVTGRLPFEGNSSLSIALKHRTEKPIDPVKYNPQIPLDLSRLILKCLEKDKEKRFQSVEEVLSELLNIENGISATNGITPRKKSNTSNQIKETFRKRWMMISALVMVIILVGMAISFNNNKKPVLSSGEKMLVVLPFDNLGPPEDEYFADGMTEEITSRLCALHGLGIISRTSAFMYKNTNRTVTQIGEELGVDYVLEGAVRWDRTAEGKGRVRVTPQLIRVSDDTHLWSGRYDRIIEDIFSVQSEIAEEVAKQLDLTVLKRERNALNAKPTDNLKAYDCYLQGKKHEGLGWAHSDTQEFERAIEMFKKAIELDPEFAQAYINLSIMHSRMYHFGVDRTDDRLEKSRATAYRALELQRDLPDAHLAMAFYYYWGLLDYDLALNIFKSIQKARPNFSPELLGYIQRRQGKWKQAVVTLEKAFKFNPRYSQLAYEIGLCHISIHNYKEAKEWFDRTLSLNPKHLAAQLGKIGILILSKGDTKEARILLKTMQQHKLTDYMWITLEMAERNYQEALDRLSSLSYDSFEEQHFYFNRDLALAAVYHAKKEYSLMKRHAELAHLTLRKELREHPQDPRFHAALGLVYAYLGRKDEAIQEGNRVVSLYPVSKDATFGPVYVLNMARILTVVGDYDEAVDKLEYLLSIPFCEYLWQRVSVPYIRLDPQWDPLRKHLGFKRLCSGSGL